MRREFDSPPPIMPTCRDGVLPLTAEKEHKQRLAVRDEARKWIRTPYHQQADIVGAGVDCSMLLVRAWVDAGIFEPFDPRPYPPNWHMHQSEERYLGWMQTLASEIPEGQAQIADIRLMTFGKCFSHSGIITRPGVMVHAHQKCGVCCESDVFETWIKYFDRTGKRLRPTMHFDIWAKIREVHGNG